MNSFTYVLVCAQVFFIQNIVAQCNSPPLYNRPPTYSLQGPIRSPPPPCGSPPPPCGTPPPPCGSPPPPCGSPPPPCGSPPPPCGSPPPPCGPPSPPCGPPPPCTAAITPSNAPCAGPRPNYLVPSGPCSTPGLVLPQSTPAAPHHHHITLPNGCGFTINGDNLLIDGTVEICGSIPFVSHVLLDGKLPADGSASVQNSCYCGNGFGY